MAQQVVRAEKLIDFVPPQPVVEPTGDPVGDVVGRVDARVDGVSFATNSVDGSMGGTLGSSVFEYHVDARPDNQQLTDIALDWVHRSFTAYPRFVISDAPDAASVVIRRGGTVYDRATSGEIVVLSGHASSSTGLAKVRGTFRASASNAFGVQISVTGSFDIESMPFVLDTPR
jgi:hypothetical protein